MDKKPQGLEYIECGKEGKTWALCEPFLGPVRREMAGREPKQDHLYLGPAWGSSSLCVPALLIS